MGDGGVGGCERSTEGMAGLYTVPNCSQQVTHSNFSDKQYPE